MQASLPVAPELVLVTDLDGTCWPASQPIDDACTAGLVSAASRCSISLPPAERSSVAQLFDALEHAALRQPHLVISDVGCTVACGASLELVPMVVDDIERQWQPFPERVGAHPRAAGLSPSPCAERRNAFDVDPELMDPELMQRPRQEEWIVCSLMAATWMFAPGVNKGSTLQRVLELLECRRCLWLWRATPSMTCLSNGFSRCDGGQC